MNYNFISAGMNEKLIITNEDFESALKSSRPSSLHQVNFFKGPKVNWTAVGGLIEVKEKLIEIVCWPKMVCQEIFMSDLVDLIINVIIINR